MFHEGGITYGSAPIVRKVERFTKDRAKALVASGMQRAVAAHGMDRLALAGGCSRRCVEKALGHETLPGIDIIANMLDEDPTMLNEFFAAKGLQLTPIAPEPNADFSTLAGMCDAAAEFSHALADGIRSPSETAGLAKKFRPLLPAMTAIVREADQLVGAG